MSPSKVVAISSLKAKGRCLKTVRNLAPATLILQDKPSVFIPDSKTPPICVSCFKLLDLTNRHPCSKCSLLLCSSECEEKIGLCDHSVECALLSQCSEHEKIGELLERTGDWKYEIIAVLRILLTGLDNPCFRDLLDNIDKLKADTDEWADYSDNVVTFLEKHFGDKWTVSEMERSAGILRTNAYCVEAGDVQPGGMVRIIYPQLSIINHSCRANSRCVVKDDFSMEVYSLEEIRKGDEVTISYLPTVFMTLPERQKKLEKTWFFKCDCSRCGDSSEFGTHFSSVVCPGCRSCCTPSADTRADTWSWHCEQCDKLVPEAMVTMMETKLEDDMNLNSEDNEHLEEVIQRYENIFPVHHCKILELKVKIVKLFGNEEDYKDEPTFMREDLIRKLELCNEVMDVLTLLEPGLSEWRAHFIYEKIWPSVALLKMHLETRSIKFKDFKQKIKVLKEDLQLARRCLEIDQKRDAMSDKIRKSIQYLNKLI